jgi:hypothetical protein
MEGKQMIDEIKIMLGDAASNYTDAQISLAYKLALTEVETYCKREADEVLKLAAESIAVIKLNRINTEGLASQGFSGVSESYINGYPAEIVALLNSKRKLKVM